MTGPGREEPQREDESIWESVDRLVDRVADLERLRTHGLHLLAHRRLRERGEPVPADLEAEAAAATAVTLAAPLVLEAVRKAYAGTILVIKGPEAAAVYPDPATRPFRDLDVIVDDVSEARRALLRAGFHEVGDPRLYVGIHHLRPLALPELPLPVELHERPKWVPWTTPPETQVLLRLGVPGASGVDGVLSLPPAQHAVLLAVHSWAHEPLARALDLIDVSAVAQDDDPHRLDAVARSWGVERLWRTTARASRVLLGRESRLGALRLWAGCVLEVRERTVLESHLERLFSPYAAQRPARAAAETPRVLLTKLTPHDRETWRRKVRRSRAALRNAWTPRSRHDELTRARERSGAPGGGSRQREHQIAPDRGRQAENDGGVETEADGGDQQQPESR